MFLSTGMPIRYSNSKKLNHIYEHLRCISDENLFLLLMLGDYLTEKSWNSSSNCEVITLVILPANFSNFVLAQTKTAFAHLTKE